MITSLYLRGIKNDHTQTWNDPIVGLTIVLLIEKRKKSEDKKKKWSYLFSYV